MKHLHSASNIEDLDLDNKRVRVRSKGGDTDWLHFQTGSARLLPRVIGGRTRGPLFLADRAPVPARAPATFDRCPETGRARLSYRRAAALFRQASGGWTLHQLRHSALTHLAEQNVSLPLLMAKADTPAYGRCSATPARAPKPSPRSRQPPTPPDGAADHHRGPQAVDLKVLRLVTFGRGYWSTVRGRRRRGISAKDGDVDTAIVARTSQRWQGISLPSLPHHAQRVAP
jgi:hypothetical protein